MKTWMMLAAAVLMTSMAGAVQPSLAQKDMKASSGGGQTAGKGNPCSTNKNTKACRDWILGNPKPKIPPKR